MSVKTASMPTLSMTRIPAQDKRRETQRFSDSTKIRRFCKLGRKRRFVLLLAWETLLPIIGPLPVTWQTRAIAHSLVNFRNREKREYSVKTTTESMTCEKQLCRAIDQKFNNWRALHLTVFGERMHVRAGDDKMVEDAHVDQRQRLHQRTGQHEVGFARLGRAGRMIVGQQ